MGAKKKKIKAFGKFRVGKGTNISKRYNAIEAKQRGVHKSPFHPTGKAKRIASGIWKCTKTGKVFAGRAYFLEEKI